MESGKLYKWRKSAISALVPLSIQQHVCYVWGVGPCTLYVWNQPGSCVVLFMNGVGTLLFIAITKGKAPAYLGSSFAFLARLGW